MVAMVVCMGDWWRGEGLGKTLTSPPSRCCYTKPALGDAANGTDRSPTRMMTLTCYLEISLLLRSLGQAIIIAKTRPLVIVPGHYHYLIPSRHSTLRQSDRLHESQHPSPFVCILSTSNQGQHYHRVDRPGHCSSRMACFRC